MEIDRANLDTTHCAKERTRYAMQCIRLTPKGTVMTDGRRLAFIGYPAEPDPESVPAPTNGHIGGKLKQRGKQAILLAVDDAKAIGKAIPRHPYREHAGIAYIDTKAANDKGTLPITTFDKGGTATTLHTPRKGDGVFPDHEPITPRRKAHRSIRLNPKYLADACKLLQQVCKADQPIITLELRGDTDAVVIRAETGSNRKAFVLLMPMRTV